jgi:hypothetical protein
MPKGRVNVASNRHTIGRRVLLQAAGAALVARMLPKIDEERWSPSEDEGVQPKLGWDSNPVDILADIEEAKRQMLAATGLRPRIYVVGAATIAFINERYGLDMMGSDLADLEAQMGCEIVEA